MAPRPRWRRFGRRNTVVSSSTAFRSDRRIRHDVRQRSDRRDRARPASTVRPAGAPRPSPHSSAAAQADGRLNASLLSWRHWRGLAVSPSSARWCSALLPKSDGNAWTPGTHILLGEAVLRSHAACFPPPSRPSSARIRHDFLYGSIAADTSIAKKYAKFGRHCHSWAVGLEIT